MDFNILKCVDLPNNQTQTTFVFPLWHALSTVSNHPWSEN